MRRKSAREKEKKSPSIKAEHAEGTSGCRDLPARSKPFRREGTVGGRQKGWGRTRCGKGVVTGAGWRAGFARGVKQRGLERGVGA